MSRNNKKRRSWHNSAQRQELINLLISRDGYYCYHCKGKLILDLKDPSGQEVTIEHIQPLAYGGSNKLVNLALAHAICNELAGRVSQKKYQRWSSGKDEKKHR